MGKKSSKANLVRTAAKGELGRTRDVPSQVSGHSSDSPFAESVQLFWKALKKEDIDQLTSLLFQKTGSSRSFSTISSSSRSPQALNILSQCGVKKMLPLVYAVEEGLSGTCLSLLLQAGAPINKVDESSSRHSALHAACWNEDEALLPLLLCAGADVRVRDAEGRTPLHILASSSSAVPVMKYILNFVRFPSALGPEMRKTGDQIFEETDDQARDGRDDALKGLQLDPLEVLSIQDQYGMTPLHIAVSEVAQRMPAFMAIYLLAFLEKEWNREEAKKRAGGEASDSGLSPRQERIKQLIALCAHGSNTVMHTLFSGQSDDKEIGEVQTMLNLVNMMLKLNTANLVGLVNARGDTPLHLALYAIGELSSSKVEEIAQEIFSVLFSALLKSPVEPKEPSGGSATVEGNCLRFAPAAGFARLGEVFSQPNSSGMVWVHVAITQHCNAALSALEALLSFSPLESEEISSAVMELKRVAFGDVKTEEGETTSEIFASELAVYSRRSEKGARGGISQSVLMKIEKTLKRLEVVEEEELKALVEVFREIEEEEDEEQEETNKHSEASRKAIPEDSMLSLATTENDGKRQRLVSPRSELRSVYSSRIQRARKGRALRINNAKKERELLKEEEKITENDDGKTTMDVKRFMNRKNINGRPFRKDIGKKSPARSTKLAEEQDAEKTNFTGKKAVAQPGGGGIFQSAYVFLILLLFLVVGIALSLWP